MATSTERFGFTKPAGSDPASVVPLNSNIDLIELYLGRTQDSIAPLYDDTETYSVGDLRTYESRLYKCNTDILTPETFDPEKWDLTTAVNEGGGGAGAIEKKQSEYDALTPAQKTNGAIYMVQAGEQPQDTSGTFVTGSARYEKVEINCGFRPDYIEVTLPFSSGDTTAIYDASVSITTSTWEIPQEGNKYTIELGSETGETGITDITDTGFKFRCNASNTRGVTCTFTASKEGQESVNKIYYMGTEYANTNGGSGGGAGAIEKTQSEYNALTPAQKENGSIYMVQGEGASEDAFDMTQGSSYNEGSMSFTATETDIESVWNGGGSIGGDWRTIAIDVTYLTAIKFGIKTTTCYAHNNSNVEEQTTPRFVNTVYLFTSIPSGWAYDYESQATDFLKFAYTNTDYGEQEFDVSELTGQIYVIWASTGWNAVMSDLTLVGKASLNNRIFFMGKEYANTNGGSSVSGEIKLSGTELLSTPISADGTYTLEDTVEDYDYLAIQSGASNERDLRTLIVDEILDIVSNNLVVTCAGTNNRWFNITALSGNQISVTRQLATIYSIKGYRYKEPKITVHEYAEFDGTDYFTTPFEINEDYTVGVTFQSENVSPSSIYGNLSASAYSHLTIYSNTWYMSTGTSETNWGTFSNTKHTFESNKNGKNVFDGTEVTNYTPTSVSGARYIVGYRIQSGNFQGKLYEFKLTSISTGDEVYDLVPADKDGVAGLYDKVSGTFTPCDFITLGGVVS